MKIITFKMKTGGVGFKVINLKNDTTMFSSYSRIDCEQYIYARRYK